MANEFSRWRWIADDDVEFDLSNEPEVEVIDFHNIGMPAATINTTPSALSGANVNLARFNSHRIPLVIKLQGDDYEANEEVLDSLREALYPIGPKGPRLGQLQLERASGRISRIPVISESGLEQAGDWYRGPHNWVFSAIFLALRPTWRAIDYVAGIPETDFALGGGIQWPLEWPFTVLPTRIEVKNAVTNAGDAIGIVVEFTLIASEEGILNPTIVHEESGRFASVTRQFANGQKILFYNITPDDIGVITGNSDLAPFLDTSSRGLPMYLGTNTYTVWCERGSGTVQMRYLPEYNGG